MTDPLDRSRGRWVLSAVDEYEGRLTRYALHLTGDAQLARDVVQHTFLRLCEHDRERLDGRLSQWLFTVCRNRAMDLHRKNGRMQSLSTVEQDAQEGREPDPAEAAQTSDAAESLRTAIDQLPDAQREAIDLWSDGLTYRQIAEITGRTEGNVRVLVHRAIKQLRDHPITKSLLADE